MLKLIFHNPVFGPIDLEYDRPVIRIGRSEDNDLVLRHPSVAPHHCQLVARGEKLLWLAADQAVPAESDLHRLAGPEFGVGDQLQIGELLLNVARSSHSVAIPILGLPQSGAGAFTAETRAAAGAAQKSYFCPHCRVIYQPADLKRVGLVGHPKRWLCPKCSHVFEVEPEALKPAPTQPPPAARKWLGRSAPKPAPAAPTRICGTD